MERFDGPARLFLASALCGLLASGATAPWARAIGALPLVLYLPGRCFMAATFPHRRAGGETQALSVALSLAVVVLLGLVLDACRALGPTIWLQVLLAFCSVSCVIAVVALARTDRELEPQAVRVPLGSAHLAGLAIAVALAGWAYGEASRGASAQRSDLYTDFWMVPVGVPTPSSAVLGVRNQEGGDATYAVDLVGRGALLGRIPAFALQAGEERTLRVALPAVAFADPAGDDPEETPVSGPAPVGQGRDRKTADLRVEARLYKNGDRGLVYRRAWVALPAPRADTAEVAQVDDAGPAGTLAFPGDVADTLRTNAAPNRAALFESPEAAPGPPLTRAASRPDPTRATAETQIRVVPDAGATDIASEMRADAADVSRTFRSPDFASRSAPGEPPSDTPLE